MSSANKKDKNGQTIKMMPNKIIIDTQGQRSGSCIFHNLFYLVGAVIVLLYGAFLLDKAAFKEYSHKYSLGYIDDVFHFIEEYSPFHQFLESDEEFIQRMRDTVAKQENNNRVRVFTKEELAKYDGNNKNDPTIYLALLGVVYDVSKGKNYYGPGGGYAFFSGKDGSRAFVTGQFDEAGLIEDVSGLELGNYLGLQEWSDFYAKDYKKVGVLEGRYYDSNGEVTEEWKKLQGWIQDAQADSDSKDKEKQMFPPCNAEWSREDGSRYWCTKKSGGIERDWVGVPRRLFYPGREERCACVRTTGPPSVDPSAKSNRGDLDNPHLKEYPGCESTNSECWKKD